MNEHETIRLIQAKLKTEIQELMLKRGFTRQTLASDKNSILHGATRQYIAAVATAHICNIKAAESLRDWLLSLPERKDG